MDPLRNAIHLRRALNHRNQRPAMQQTMAKPAQAAVACPNRRRIVPTELIRLPDFARAHRPVQARPIKAQQALRAPAAVRHEVIPRATARCRMSIVFQATAHPAAKPGASKNSGSEPGSNSIRNTRGRGNSGNSRKIKAGFQVFTTAEAGERESFSVAVEKSHPGLSLQLL